MDKNVSLFFFSLVRTYSHCKGDVAVHVQQESPWLYTNLQSLHFHGTEKAIKLAKKVK